MIKSDGQEASVQRLEDGLKMIMLLGACQIPGVFLALPARATGESQSLYCTVAGNKVIRCKGRQR